MAYPERSDELLERLERTCSNLGEWLRDPHEARLAADYGPVARHRCRQGVPLAEIVLLAQLFKRRRLHLRSCRRRCEREAGEGGAEEGPRQDQLNSSSASAWSAFDGRETGVYCVDRRVDSRNRPLVVD